MESQLAYFQFLAYYFVKDPTSNSQFFVVLHPASHDKILRINDTIDTLQPREGLFVDRGSVLFILLHIVGKYVSLLPPT